MKSTASSTKGMPLCPLKSNRERRFHRIFSRASGSGPNYQGLMGITCIWSMQGIWIRPAGKHGCWDGPLSAVTRQTKLFTLDNRYMLRKIGRLKEDCWRHFEALTQHLYLNIKLSGIEQRFKELKQDLAVRPAYHQTDDRLDIHIFVSFSHHPHFLNPLHQICRKHFPK